MVHIIHSPSKEMKNVQWHEWMQNNYLPTLVRHILVIVYKRKNV